MFSPNSVDDFKEVVELIVEDILSPIGRECGALWRRLEDSILRPEM